MKGLKYKILNCNSFDTHREAHHIPKDKQFNEIVLLIVLKEPIMVDFRVNTYHVVHGQAPFGGFKMSGIGREMYVYIYIASFINLANSITHFTTTAICIFSGVQFYIKN